MRQPNRGWAASTPRGFVLCSTVRPSTAVRCEVGAADAGPPPTIPPAIATGAAPSAVVSTVLRRTPLPFVLSTPSFMP